MKRVICSMAVMLIVLGTFSAPVRAENTAKHGEIKGRTVVAGLTSLLLWPGIGQYLNHNETKKNWTHALIGILPPFRLWSGWDALIGRQGGRWDGKI